METLELSTITKICKTQQRNSTANQKGEKHSTEWRENKNYPVLRENKPDKTFK